MIFCIRLYIYLMIVVSLMGMGVHAEVFYSLLFFSFFLGLVTCDLEIAFANFYFGETILSPLKVTPKLQYPSKLPTFKIGFLHQNLNAF